ncbi:MAG: hypothetical protein ACLT3W_07275 [Bifidobacterium pseudocatenulatum]
MPQKSRSTLTDVALTSLALLAGNRSGVSPGSAGSVVRRIGGAAGVMVPQARRRPRRRHATG